MSKHFTPPISIEKFAAYLDNNLPEYEMREIDSMVDSNCELRTLMDINDDVDEVLNAETLSLPEIEFCQLSIPNVTSGEGLISDFSLGIDDESFDEIEIDDLDFEDDGLDDLDDILN